MLEKIKRPFETIISPFCRGMSRMGISPNIITAVGLAFIIVGSILIAFGQYRWAVLWLVLGGILDAADGKVARDTGQSTRFGAFLDSTLDRISEIAIGLGLLISFRHSGNYEFASILIFISISGSLMTSYVRARGQGISCDPKSGWLQRPERGIIIAVCLWFGPRAILWGIGLIAVVSYFTVIQRVLQVRKALGRENNDPAVGRR